MNSGDVLQRIALVEASYVELGNATRAAIAAGELDQDDPLVRQIVMLGQEIAGWKPIAQSLAYKSPWDGARECTAKLQLIHRTGQQLADRTGRRNPAIDPDPYTTPGAGGVWPWVILAAVIVAGIVVWKVL